MKKTKRLPVWGEQLPRHLQGTLVELDIWAWHGGPERSTFVVRRYNLGRVSDRRDANRMYRWMRRRTSMVEVVRAQLAREAASA